MKLRVFIDTNVFIYAFEYPASNSAKVIELLNKDKIEGIISEQVFKEVLRYFGQYHSKELAKIFRRYLLESCHTIPREQVYETMETYANRIKKKDLEQLAVVKKYGIKYLVTYDRDFNDVEEYVTPKKFVRLVQEKDVETEY